MAVVEGSGRRSSEEAIWLRDNWNPDMLGRFENLWIAVKGQDVIGASDDLDQLMDRTMDAGPLYAFVHFGVLQ